eukprot:g62789.t1
MVYGQFQTKQTESFSYRCDQAFSQVVMNNGEDHVNEGMNSQNQEDLDLESNSQIISSDSDSPPEQDEDEGAIKRRKFATIRVHGRSPRESQANSAMDVLSPIAIRITRKEQAISHGSPTHSLHNHVTVHHNYLYSRNNSPGTTTLPSPNPSAFSVEEISPNAFEKETWGREQEADAQPEHAEMHLRDSKIHPIAEVEAKVHHAYLARLGAEVDVPQEGRQSPVSFDSPESHRFTNASYNGRRDSISSIGRRRTIVIHQPPLSISLDEREDTTAPVHLELKKDSRSQQDLKVPSEDLTVVLMFLLPKPTSRSTRRFVLSIEKALRLELGDEAFIDLRQQDPTLALFPFRGKQNLRIVILGPDAAASICLAAIGRAWSSSRAPSVAVWPLDSFIAWFSRHKGSRQKQRNLDLGVGEVGKFFSWTFKEVVDVGGLFEAVRTLPDSHMLGLDRWNVHISYSQRSPQEFGKKVPALVTQANPLSRAPPTEESSSAFPSLFIGASIFVESVTASASASRRQQSSPSAGKLEKPSNGLRHTKEKRKPSPRRSNEGLPREFEFEFVHCFGFGIQSHMPYVSIAQRRVEKFACWPDLSCGFPSCISNDDTDTLPGGKGGRNEIGVRIEAKTEEGEWRELRLRRDLVGIICLNFDSREDSRTLWRPGQSGQRLPPQNCADGLLEVVGVYGLAQPRHVGTSERVKPLCQASEIRITRSIRDFALLSRTRRATAHVDGEYWEEHAGEVVFTITPSGAGKSRILSPRANK